MGTQNRPRDESWLRRTLNDILTRLRALETAPRTRHAGVSGGTLRVTNGGKIVIEDTGGTLITIDPNRDGRPTVVFELPDSGGVTGSVTSALIDGIPAIGMLVHDAGGALRSQVAATVDEATMYVEGGGEAKITTWQADVRYRNPDGSMRSTARATIEGADIAAFDSAGNIVSYMWAQPDGTVHYKGTLVQD
ncbi:hypothetical protein FZ103_00325 [Streptomonospora sp. PA3]|uniref:hypothetical protein n=1 Tax=Streptomonospora sp. PA3 TaxID=2607326 RepID=UPI0012DE7CC5|nr:hypothetical protein [Streptomonospora sp. PA3]MUL39639.1 hypothetical protein [Streptomonospora sp. PA3]